MSGLPIMFNSTSTQACFTVHTTGNDGFIESNQIIIFVAEVSEDAVEISPSRNVSQVVVVDNDGRCIYLAIVP